MKTSLMNFFGLALATFLFSVTGIAQNTYSVELSYVDHLKAGFIEQDVYVEKVKGSNEVYRLLPEEREKYMDAEIFTTKEAHHHQPFDPTQAGPYAKGKSLGMTLGEWLKGTGTATCACEDGWGVLEASFKNLAPNATYTMWQSFMAKDNAENFIGTFDLPLGERDGSQSVFKTDANGNAEINVRFENCVQLTDTQLMSLLAVAWHSDDKTYGVTPGPFGQVTHVQLFTVLPDVDDIKETGAVGQRK